MERVELALSMNLRLLHALYLLGNKFEKLLSSICVHMGIKDDRDSSSSIGKKHNSINAVSFGVIT